MLERVQSWARRLKALLLAVWVAGRDPRTPWYAKALAACVLAYALSPIDLIPDIIPLLGYLDDLILLPLGIALVVRLIPPQVWADARAAAQGMGGQRLPVSRAGAVVIVALWIALVAVVVWWAVR